MNAAAPDYAQEIQRSAREILARTASTEGLLERLRAEDVSRGAWDTAAQAGWFRLLSGEAAGGLGAGPAELAALFREIGRHLAAGPWVDTVVAAGLLRDHADLGPDTALIGYLPEPGAVVEFAAVADVLVVRGPDSIGLARGALAMPLKSFDLAGRPAQVDLTGATVEAVVEGAEAERVAVAIARLARVARSGELAGLAAAALDMSVCYAGERVQFDRPIGAFQAVQHRIAEMAVTRTAVDSALAAIVTLAASEGTDAEQAALYEYAAGEARTVVLSALQVHGGIGFSAEHPLHAYIKRVLRLQAVAGEGEPLLDLGGRLLAG